MSSSPSSATTATPAPGWTGPVSTRCAIKPKPVPSRPSGACPRTGWPAPTPTRFSSSTSWPSSGCGCCSATHPRWTTTRRPGCSPRCRASSPSTSGPRSPNATGAADCSGPGPARWWPGRRPMATAGCPASATAPARLEIYEPEAAVVRRIYDDYVAGGQSIRHIMRRAQRRADPHAQRARPSGGTPRCAGSCRNEAYVGRVYFNQTETLPTQHRRPTRPPPRHHPTAPATRGVDRDPLPAHPRRRHLRGRAAGQPGQLASGAHATCTTQAWLLRGLVRCGSCDINLNSHKLGRHHRQDPPLLHLPQQGAQRRPRPAAVPGTLHPRRRAGRLRLRTSQDRPAPPHRALRRRRRAVRATAPSTDDELLATELDRLARKLDANRAERRRLADLYQSGLLELTEVQRRARRHRHRATTPCSSSATSSSPNANNSPSTTASSSESATSPAEQPLGIDKLNFAPTPTTAAPHRRPRQRHRLASRDPPADPPRRRPRGPTRSRCNWRPHYGHRRHTTRPPAPSTTTTPRHACLAKTVCDPFVGSTCPR